MKKLLLLFLFSLFIVGVSQINAQTQVFDPATDPVAVRADSSVRLIVSEYVLLKSVQAPEGTVMREVQKKRFGNVEYLVFKGLKNNDPLRRVSIAIRLMTNEYGFCFAEPIGISCEGNGCSSCDIKNENACDCMDPQATEPAGGSADLCPVTTAILQHPLRKISTLIQQD